MWDINDIAAPDSEAVQAEREIVEEIVRNEPTVVSTPTSGRHGHPGPGAVPDGAVTFKRLRNGAWGITGPAALLVEGTDVAVTKRDGDTTVTTVSRVLWSGEGRSIASIKR